jgi:hypothetical protein
MRLRRVTLTRYRQFVDETLIVDRNVTVVVGRNDTGKTGLLDHFFDQCVYEGLISSGDRTYLPQFRGNPTEWSLVWDIFSEDYDSLEFPPALGPRGTHRLEVRFRERDSPLYWTYLLDEARVNVYQRQTSDGTPIRPRELELRNITPVPYCFTGRSALLTMFEMQPYELREGETVVYARHPRQLEPLLLRLAGIPARTRTIAGRGAEEPWAEPHLKPSSIAIEDIETRLGSVADRLTTVLRRWWLDPPDLSVRIHLAGAGLGRELQVRHRTYIVVVEILDADGTTYRGAGLLWFLGFLIELLLVQDGTRPALFLFDEPATPLHPSAQRTVAKLLNSLSERHQVIYSTHSPFMIDWNFPHRLRLLRRESVSKRSRIENKPYHPAQGVERVWDPLRSAIGVTLGDIAVVGEKNVLVEGVTDQILLASASAALAAQGRAHLDLDATAIIPYSDRVGLEHLIAAAKGKQGSVVVLADNDEQGRRTEKCCLRIGVPILKVGPFTTRPTEDSSVEDVLGIDAYIRSVNELYGEMPWFQPFSAEEVARAIGRRSLGSYLKNFFADNFQKDFDKVATATFIADSPERFTEGAMQRLEALIAECAGALESCT